MADRHPLPGRGLQPLQIGLVVSRAGVLDAPRTPPEDHTTWTVVAPGPVFTVLMYGTRRLGFELVPVVTVASGCVQSPHFIRRHRVTRSHADGHQQT
jgi:hypothetical protein